jgi:hypothetical protein
MLELGLPWAWSAIYCLAAIQSFQRAWDWALPTLLDKIQDPLAQQQGLLEMPLLRRKKK